MGGPSVAFCGLQRHRVVIAAVVPCGAGDDHLGLDLDVANRDAGQRAFVPISAGRVQRHLLAEHQIGQRSLGCLPERLA